MLFGLVFSLSYIWQAIVPVGSEAPDEGQHIQVIYFLKNNQRIPVFDQDRKVTHVLFIFKDVTGEWFMQEERERAMKERDDAKALIQNVLDQTRAVIYIKDLDGKFLFVNGHDQY